MNKLTAHQLAAKLLEGPDLPVVVAYEVEGVVWDSYTGCLSITAVHEMSGEIELS